MKRTMIAAALLLAAAARAEATSLDTYRDLIRPHGHARSDAVFDAALNACYAQTGASRFRADPPAFRQCMLGRGYRWKSVRNVPEPRTRVSEPDTSYHPPDSPPFELPPPPPTVSVDPLTGEVHVQ
jgi:hypothetical protein